ncbi:hypothetical protein ABFS82_02G149400 [Erythranthe guttata]|nr:PREDICTED: agamous-like MADS-box protein AGL80 [Erythranthe guttata]|eukprot:XP_012843584.1 PREDICTED: agamous-like MADS-box protein AGL80 [Erythranthe guttata]
MPRKNTKYVQIPSEKTRKITLRRRLDSLFKRANELSVLCGIEILIVVHNRNEGHSTLWPTQDKVVDGITKFLNFPERERIKKMVTQEKFLTDKVQDLAGKLLKLQKKNDETEMGLLMGQLIETGTTHDALDARRVNGLYRLVEEKLEKLRNRREELYAMREYNCFGGTVSGVNNNNNNVDLLNETEMEIRANEVTNSFVEGNRGELLGEVWPMMF